MIKKDIYDSFRLEEYYPYRKDNYVLNKDDELLNTKSIKIEIDCPIIDKEIEFLQ